MNGRYVPGWSTYSQLDGTIIKMATVTIGNLYSFGCDAAFIVKLISLWAGALV